MVYKKEQHRNEKQNSNNDSKKDTNNEELKKEIYKSNQNIKFHYKNETKRNHNEKIVHNHNIIYKSNENYKQPMRTFTVKPPEPEKKEPIPEKEPLSAAEMWKNAAKILGSKKVIKKPPIEIQKIDFDLPKYSPREFSDALHQSILYRSPIEKKKVLNEKIQVPDFFPKKPIHIFEGPDVYNKLDIDTLFFIFYFSKGESQVFSARELKKYSWRYHTKYKTWFQRLEEPKLITEYYEQGVFLFFDYEVTWTTRKKKDFTFEYKYLENIEI